MKILAIIVSTLISVAGFAQDAQTDAEYLKITIEYTLNDDGSVDYHYYKKLKLNTHFSFNRLYGETFIVYNPDYQKLKINISRTTHRDGQVVEAPFNSFNEVLPGFASGVPAHNGLREMVVTHPGLEVGAVVELDYTIHTQSGFYPGLMADEVLTESSPVSQKEIIVHVPAGQALNYNLLNSNTSPEVAETKSSTTYTFTFNGLEESSHEGFQPEDETHLPRLYFSTVSFPEALAGITAQEAFSYRVDGQLKKYADELRKEHPDDVDLVLALQKMVTENINSWRVPPQYIEYRMRTAGETWSSNGGTPCEKTILMAAVLRATGINAIPVMVIPSKLYDEKTGCLSLADQTLLQVNPREKEQMYISAVSSSDQNLIYGLTGKTILLFEPEKQYVESISEIFTNKVITSGDFVLGEDLTLSGSMEMLLTEKANPYYSFLEDSTKARSLVAGGLSGKDVVASEIVNSAQFRTLAKLTVESKKAAKETGGYYFWDIPLNRSGSEGWRLNYLYSDRSSSFEVPFTIDEEYSYKVSLPAGFELVNPVELTELEHAFGSLVLSTQQKGNTVTIKRMLVIKSPVIMTEDYQAFKEMMDLWNEKNFRQLVLKKAGNP